MRPLSPRAIQATQDLETGEVFLYLLTISHSTLPVPWTLVNNTEDVTSNGIVYTAFPFSVVLGDDTGEELPKVALVIDNIERGLVEMIRSQVEPPDISITFVLASEPDIELSKGEHMTLRELSFDAFTISGTLFSDDIQNSRYPAHTISLAGGYLGLFR